VNTSWWAGGLALAERLPRAAEQDPSQLERAHRRLARWRDAHGLGSGGFSHRLSDAGLDEGGLIGLLTEPTDALAARMTKPTWAASIERAVAAASGAVADQGVSTEAFAEALRPLVQSAETQVLLAAQGISRVDSSAIASAFAGQLGKSLVRMAARTLVLELNVARVTDRLSGESAAERFADFIAQLATEPKLGALFAEYPVLARLLGQHCQHAVDAMIELLTRFAADGAAIVGQLFGGTDPGVLREIRLGSGDLHKRGRSVGILRFDSSSVVYKPRCQQMQVRFGELVNWLNAKVPGLGLRTPSAVAQDGYGWVEYVAPAPCSEIAEVDRFYRRQGALLALLYAVDGTDVHYENLIAAADQPVLVDVETLFHPSLPPVMTAGADPATAALTSSVVRTGLLPQLMLGEHGALDISGLGGDKDSTFPLDVVRWDAAGTDEMRLVRRAGQFTGADNRPRLGSRDADPAEYRAALLTGFRTAYDAIVAHRSELLGGLLDRFAGCEMRIVFRPTRTYSLLLDESTHPDVLRDGLDRDGVLDLLWADASHDPVLRRLVRSEIDDLWAGDVPIFTSRPVSRDVWTTMGERLPDLLERPSFDTVTTKIMRMDEVDRLDQEWLITAALSTRGQAVEHRSGDSRPTQTTAAVPDPQRLLAAACGIADEIVARSLHDPDRANWLSVELIDGKHWAVVPMGAGLGDGYPGVALFLAQLGKLTGSARYADLARKAIHPVPKLIDVLTAELDIARAVGPGGFLGLGGICYALARLTTLLGDAEIGSWLRSAVSLAGVADDGQSHNVAQGSAGGLLSMIAVEAETGIPTDASAFADRLLRPAGDGTEEVLPPQGFAGGGSGIGYALLQVGGRYAAEGQAAIERDGELGERLAQGNLSWCTGLAGSLVARAQADGADLDKYVTALADRTPLRDLSLCHGELGVIEALTILAGRGNELAATVLPHSASRMLGALDTYGPRCGTPDGVLSPGLLTGLSGIGYGLLRLGFPETVPSLLLLEPTR
jgi:type 2 lantibiotic biosynthesis protein LanM